MAKGSRFGKGPRGFRQNPATVANNANQEARLAGRRLEIINLALKRGIVKKNKEAEIVSLCQRIIADQKVNASVERLHKSPRSLDLSNINALIALNEKARQFLESKGINVGKTAETGNITFTGGSA
ncbi:MAG: hypothetical protein V1494_07665 [Candidatus Diapherotrites archaeon]